MLAITHFEVYALIHGRWTLHARYTSEDRQEAIIDARTTELATGHPTKVMCEVYYPDDNETEVTTAYQSPKAKELSDRKRAKLPARAVKTAVSVLKRTKRVRPQHQGPLNMSAVFFRIVVAALISLVASTLVTGIIVWTLNRFAALGVALPSSVMPTVTTYSYVLLFLFFFFSLFRSRLPLARLLTDLWQRSKLSSPSVAATQSVGAKPPKVKPKHDRADSPQVAQELEDLKIKRGDPAVAPPPTLTDPPPQANPPVVAPAPAAVDATMEQALKAEAEKQKAAAAERAAKEKKRAEAEALRVEAEALRIQEKFDLERDILQRFVHAVVIPALDGTVPDDPVTRRGAALVLAGAAASLCRSAGLSETTAQELLMSTLPSVGMSDAGIEVFMAQYEQHVAAPANQSLVDMGRRAISVHLEGKADVRPVLAAAMASWRTPFGQPLSAPAQFVPTALPPGVLHDVFLLTEVRADTFASEDMADAAKDTAMGQHNSVVRTILADHAGHELKHTGKGIFARFATAKAAAAAADELRVRFDEANIRAAIVVIGNRDVAEDTAISPTLFHRAEAMVAKARPGHVQYDEDVEAILAPADAALLDVDGAALPPGAGTPNTDHGSALVA